MIQAYAKQRFICILLLGFASGLPVALATFTLQAWLTQAGVDVTTIGIFGLVGLPYVAKCLWAPVLDRFHLPFFDHRRGWIIATQVGLFICLLLMGQQDPQLAPLRLAMIALLITIFSATQDIAIDAYRTELLSHHESGQGVAMYVMGARIASLIAGGIALVISDYLGFESMYRVMAGLMLLGMLGVVLGTRPLAVPPSPKTLKTAIIEPFREFMSRDKALLLLATIILYKLGDAFSGSLTNTFLLRGLDFTLTEVGTYKKTIEIISTLLGVVFGGIWMKKLGLYRALLFFGVLQAVSNLAFMFLAMVGHHFGMMILAVFLENLCAGLGTAAFVAFLTVLCDKRYTATQFALFSALAMVGRTFASPIAGYWVAHSGWTLFYFGTFIISIPGVLLLFLLPNHLVPVRQPA